MNFVGTHGKCLNEMIPMSTTTNVFVTKNKEKSQFFKSQHYCHSQCHVQLHVSIHNNEIVCCREISVDHYLDLLCFQKWERSVSVVECLTRDRGTAG